MQAGTGEFLFTTPVQAGAVANAVSCAMEAVALLRG